MREKGEKIKDVVFFVSFLRVFFNFSDFFFASQEEKEVAKRDIFFSSTSLNLKQDFSFPFFCNRIQLLSLLFFPNYRRDKN